MTPATLTSRVYPRSPRRAVTTVAFALPLAVLLMTACRRQHAASSTEVVVQFLTMKEAAGIHGAPSPKELAALRPFVSDSLTRALLRADSIRAADIKRAPDEKPSFVDGDLFSSLFEGPTAFVVMPALDTAGAVRVPVQFTNDEQKPAVRWTDTLIVVRAADGWRVHDVRYGGTWDFSNKGALLSQLSQMP